jgi:hypothetical protein
VRPMFRTLSNGTVQGMGILTIATIFIGLALLAAVPLVALLHWTDR